MSPAYWGRNSSRLVTHKSTRVKITFLLKMVDCPWMMAMWAEMERTVVVNESNLPDLLLLEKPQLNPHVHVFSGDLIASNQLKPIHLHTSIKINKDNFMKKSVRNNHRPTLSSAFQVSKKHLTSCQNPPRDGPTPIPELLRKWMFLDGAEGRCLVPKFKMEPKQGPLGKRHMTIFWGVTWCNLSWIFGLKFQSKVAVHTFQAGVEASRGKCLTDQQQQETHL